MPVNTGDHGGRWRTVVWVSAAVMLMVPFLAMQITDQVAWTLFDFIVFAAMLVGAIGAFELAARMTHNKLYRAAVGVALAAAFLLIWVNGAVGIIGSEDNPANLMFGAVLAVGIIGALIARLRPTGMARAMVATASTQALVAVVGLIPSLGATGPIWPWDLLALTVFFVGLWLLAAWLFRRGGEEASTTA